MQQQRKRDGAFSSKALRYETGALTVGQKKKEKTKKTTKAWSKVR